MKTRALAFAVSAAAVSLAVFCSSGARAPLPAAPAHELKGEVHGGTPPVSGSHIYLFALGTGGNGGPATSLIAPGPETQADASGNFYVTSGDNGSFNLTGTYTCTEGQMVYLYSNGGDGGAGNNPAIGLLAALGVCPAGGSLAPVVPSLTVNEVSTILTAYSLAGFATSPTHVASGSSPQALEGAATAFANISNVLSIGLGAPYAAPLSPAAALPYNGPLSGAAAVTGAPGFTGSVPQAKIFTLANLLASCVNSMSAASANCTNLLAAFPNPDGSLPGDTAGVAINMAHAPALAQATLNTLFAQALSMPAFAPALTEPPSDLALPITWQTPLTAAPTALAVDAHGGLWLAADGLYFLSPQGGATAVPVAGSPTISALAVSPADGSVWFADAAHSSVGALSTAGAPLFTTRLASAPAALAFDTNGQPFVASTVASRGSNGFFHLSTSGALLSQAHTLVLTPGALAVSSQGTPWVGAARDGYGIQVYAAPYTQPVPLPYTTANFVSAASNGSMWTTDMSGNAASIVSAAGKRTVCQGGGVAGAYASTVDGASNVFLANGGSTISGFTTSCTPRLGTGLSNGVADSGQAPWLLAADPSGNLWAANYSASSHTVSLTVFLGLVAPTATPLSPAHAGMPPLPPPVTGGTGGNGSTGGGTGSGSGSGSGTCKDRDGNRNLHRRDGDRKDDKELCGKGHDQDGDKDCDHDRGHRHDWDRDHDREHDRDHDQDRDRDRKHCDGDDDAYHAGGHDLKPHAGH